MLGAHACLGVGGEFMRGAAGRSPFAGGAWERTSSMGEKPRGGGALSAFGGATIRRYRLGSGAVGRTDGAGSYPRVDDATRCSRRAPVVEAAAEVRAALNDGGLVGHLQSRYGTARGSFRIWPSFGNDGARRASVFRLGSFESDTITTTMELPAGLPGAKGARAHRRGCPSVPDTRHVQAHQAPQGGHRGSERGAQRG